MNDRIKAMNREEVERILQGIDESIPQLYERLEQIEQEEKQKEEKQKRQRKTGYKRNNYTGVELGIIDKWIYSTDKDWPCRENGKPTDKEMASLFNRKSFSEMVKIVKKRREGDK